MYGLLNVRTHAHAHFLESKIFHLHGLAMKGGGTQPCIIVQDGVEESLHDPQFLLLSSVLHLHD